MPARALSLFRQALRVLRAVPVPVVRRKLAYNVRELFDIYRAAPPSRMPELLADAEHDLQLIREILAGTPGTVHAIFRTFENMDTPHAHASQGPRPILPL